MSQAEAIRLLSHGRERDMLVDVDLNSGAGRVHGVRRPLLPSLMFLVVVGFLGGCSKERSLMTDAELDQQRAGTVAFGFCPKESSCGASIAQVISGEQTVPMYNHTCPPDCSITEAAASPGETVRLQQQLGSNGTVVIQRNTWTVAPATPSVTVIPGLNPTNPNLPR